MKSKLLFIAILSTLLCFSQEKKTYRIFLKDGTTLDVFNPKKVPNAVNYENSDGNTQSILDNKYYNIRLVSSANTEIYEPIKYSYCELIGIDTRKFFSIKPNLNVTVDYGVGFNEFESGFIIDEVTGKSITFSSMVEAMNYMGKLGWEFVQAYAISEPSGGSVYRWLLKRRIK